jgi:hypothetical protein
VAEVFQDIIPAIMTTKKDVLIDDKDYVPFVVNRALSYHYDCVLYANVMNMYPNLDKKLQFHFLLNTIKPVKRPFQKWIKKTTVEDLEAVKEFYKYSNQKAQEVLPLLSDDQLMKIKETVNSGKNNAGLKRFNMG